MHTDGSSIATGTREGEVIIWDSSTNVPLLKLQGKVFKRLAANQGIFKLYWREGELLEAPGCHTLKV